MPATETAAVTLVVDGVRVESEANSRGAWYGKSRRTRAQKDIVLGAMLRLDRAALRAAPRLRCTFQRVIGKRGRKFDDDNLVGAFKACRDAVAHAVGVDDGRDWWEWKYDPVQARGKDHAVRITFTPLAATGAAAEGET